MNYTPEHIAFQDSVRRVVDEQINPLVDEWEATGTFPARELFSRAYRDLRAISLVGGADEIMLQIICKCTRILPTR